MAETTAAATEQTTTTPEAAVAAQAQVAEAPAQKTTTKKAAAATGNLIMDVASEVESLTKTKALNLADKLVSENDSNNFKLGGVLKKIHENSWFEGFESFDAFVAARYGFQPRKARYLIEIYDNLVTKQIPWEKVQHLGWTKLKDLARHLTPENLAEWVAKAEKLTVLELQAALKAQTEGTAPAEATKTTSDTALFKVKLKNDQLETVTSALAKAKADLQTEFDNVALEGICAGFLGGTSSVAAAKPVSIEDLMGQIGWEATLQAFDKVFPKVNITVEEPPAEAAPAAAQTA